MILEYAYGCWPPEVTDHAFAEHQRCIDLWNELVRLEHAREADLLLIAQEDSADLADIAKRINALQERIGEQSSNRALYRELRALHQDQRRLLWSWTRDHKAIDEQFKLRQRAEKTHARQTSLSWWHNYNRVLMSYESARSMCARKNRRLRFRDPARDDGVLAFQIQRTRTGLGAAPAELFSNGVSGVQISAPNARGKALLSMRVDREANRIVLPVWLHRPLPPQCRIKVVQLVWRRRADRLRWQLCLTIDTCEQSRVREAEQRVPVEFDWIDREGLEVMRISERVWRLPLQWMQRLDQVERMQGELDAALKEARRRWGGHEIAGPILAMSHWRERIELIALSRPRLPEELIKWWVHVRRLWLGIPGARAHALGHRREIYRQWARDVACAYAGLELPELNIARIAHEDRGTVPNSARHRGAVHLLRAELIHQCTKAGTPVYDASGKVINAPAAQKSSSWARRRAANKQGSQNRAQSNDGPSA